MRNGTRMTARATALSAVGQTAAIPVGVASDHAIQLVVTGGPTTVTFALEGSLDGVTWTVLAGAINGLTTPYTAVAGKPVSYVRGNLSVLTAGTAPTVTMLYAGR